MKIFGALFIIIAANAYELAWSRGIYDIRWDTLGLLILGILMVLPYELFGGSHGKRK